MLHLAPRLPPDFPRLQLYLHCTVRSILILFVICLFGILKNQQNNVYISYRAKHFLYHRYDILYHPMVIKVSKEYCPDKQKRVILRIVNVQSTTVQNTWYCKTTCRDHDIHAASGSMISLPRWSPNCEVYSRLHIVGHQHVVCTSSMAHQLSLLLFDTRLD